MSDQKNTSENINWAMLDPNRKIEEFPNIIYPHPNITHFKKFFKNLTSYYPFKKGVKPPEVMLFIGASGTGKTSGLRVALNEVFASSEPPFKIVFVEGSRISGVKELFKRVRSELGIGSGWHTDVSGLSDVELVARALYELSSPLVLIVEEFDKLAANIKQPDKHAWAHSLVRLEYSPPKSFKREKVDVHIVLTSTDKPQLLRSFSSPEMYSFTKSTLLSRYDASDLSRILFLTVDNALPRGFFKEEHISTIAAKVFASGGLDEASNARFALRVLKRAVEMTLQSNLGAATDEIVLAAFETSVVESHIAYFRSKPSSYFLSAKAILDLTARTNPVDQIISQQGFDLKTLYEKYCQASQGSNELPVQKRWFFKVLSDMVKDGVLIAYSRGSYKLRSPKLMRMVVEHYERGGWNGRR